MIGEKEQYILESAFQIIEREVKNNGAIFIENKGTFELLPRRKGKTFCGFRNKEGTPQFSKRLRFKISKQLRNELCK